MVKKTTCRLMFSQASQMLSRHLLLACFVICLHLPVSAQEDSNSLPNGQPPRPNAFPPQPNAVVPEAPQTNQPNIPEPFQLPTKPPLNNFEVLWKASPFARNSSPDPKTSAAPAQYVLEAWTGDPENPKLYVKPRVKSSKDKSTQWVIISKDAKEGNKLLAFNNSSKFEDVSADVEIQGKKYTVKYDEQALKRKPIAAIQRRPGVRPANTPNLPGSNNARRPIIRKPPTATQNQAKPTVQRPRVIRRPATISRPPTQKN